MGGLEPAPSKGTLLVRHTRGAACGSGNQNKEGHGQTVGEVELHQQVCAGIQEAGEGTAAAEVEGDGGVAVVEATQKVEDDSLVRDDLTQVPKGIGHALEMPVVVRDRQIALAEVLELSVKV